jgi:hypothetical protein
LSFRSFAKYFHNLSFYNYNPILETKGPFDGQDKKTWYEKYIISYSYLSFDVPIGYDILILFLILSWLVFVFSILRKSWDKNILLWLVTFFPYLSSTYISLISTASEFFLLLQLHSSFLIKIESICLDLFPLSHLNTSNFVQFNNNNNKTKRRWIHELSFRFNNNYTKTMVNSRTQIQIQFLFLLLHTNLNSDSNAWIYTCLKKCLNLYYQTTVNLRLPKKGIIGTILLFNYIICHILFVIICVSHTWYDIWLSCLYSTLSLSSSILYHIFIISCPSNGLYISLF